MGVKGLWQLLMPVGRRISIETLEGQILAIDASIWLTQFLTVAAAKRERDLLDDGHGDNGIEGGGNNRNNNNKAYSYDYLVGFLRRLCKLRYQGVRPVIVFDGATPEIKMREIRERNKRRKRKLGDSFYLGGNSADGKEEEDEEVLEATRRAAKRILAKQLREGKLITKNNKNKKMKTIAIAAEANNVSSSVDGKTTGGGASFAPGFYDPNAIRIEHQQQHQQHQQQQQQHQQKQKQDVNGIVNDDVLKDNNDDDDDDDDDDDNLLQDDYNADAFKQEGNDWDNAIVIHEGDEEEGEDDKPIQNNSNSNNNSKRRHRRKKSKSKNATSNYDAAYSSTDIFHAGDGTEFEVDNVANLPETIRKDVIEDAMKQRRLASRREFMQVASNPDGLSNCQLRNFLKSTRLNHDIKKMAQQAAVKAEKDAAQAAAAANNEYANNSGGRNRIIFEKDNDAITAINNKSNNKKKSSIHSSRKQKGKGMTTTMMRMFHHKPQQQNSDDHADFRKTTNNYYLSGGIRRFDDDEDDDNDVDDEKSNDDDYEGNKNTEKGFVFHGDDDIDDDNKDNNNNYNDNDNDIINVDSDIEESDDDDDDAWKSQPARENEDSRVAQELHDEALARALQNIEEEENFKEGGSSDVEVIDIDRKEDRVIGDDSDDDGSDFGGGFFKSSDSPETRKKDGVLEDDSDDDGSSGGGGFLKSSDSPLAKPPSCQERDDDEDEDDEDSEDEDDAITIDKGTIVAKDAGDNITMYGIVKDYLDYDKYKDDESVEKWFVKYKYKDESKFTQNRTELLDDDSILLAYNYFRNLSDERKEIGYAMFGLTEFDVVFDTEILEFTYCNDRTIGKVVVQSSKSHRVNVDDILVSIGGESVFAKAFDQVDTIVKQHKERPIAIRFRRSVAVGTTITEGKTKTGNADIANPEGMTEIVQQKQRRQTGGGFLAAQDKNHTENSQSPSDTAGATFAMNQQNQTENSRKEGSCPDTSDEEEEVNWEDGDDRALISSKNKYNPEVIETTENRISMDTSVEQSKKTTETTVGAEDIGDDVVDDDDDDDDDDVDWEDGEGIVVADASVNNVVGVLEEIVTVSIERAENEDTRGIINADHDDDDKITWKAADTNETPTNDAIKPVELKTKTNQESDQDLRHDNLSKSSIDFTQASTSTTTAVEFQQKTVTNSYNGLQPQPQRSIDCDSNEELEEDNLHQDEGGDRFDSFRDDDWEKSTPKTKDSAEVMAALEHAQGTAASLTDWAGRAFRRAIAQHAVENGLQVPESAKPGVLKSNSFEIDDDDDNEEENVVAVKAKPTSHEDVHVAFRQGADSNNDQSTSSRNISTSNDKIDNSKWLQDVDTTSNTHVEDSTMVSRQSNQSDIMMDPSPGGITEEMKTEVMQLLRLFGIPYVVAPAEAEAQCVELEKLGLVDGIVSEDSDTFVFGGQKVYKNIFDDKKYVEVYNAKDAGEEMNLSQDALVALAMLLGGDYTEGVKGVGIVNGMEVLQAFDVAQDCKAGLQRFRQWLDGFDPNDLSKHSKKKKKAADDDDGAVVVLNKEQIFHKKHHTARTRWIAPKNFPDAKVLNAYMKPVVDTSRERFTFGIPDLDGLVDFCYKHMGWSADETNQAVVPVIKKMEESSMRQTRIDSFMRYEDGIKFANIRSKRLRNVLGLSIQDAGVGRTQQSTTSKISSSSTSSSKQQQRHGVAAMDTTNTVCENETTTDHHHKTNNIDTDRCYSQQQPPPPPPPKRYKGKTSIAALSSAAASTTAIAISSKIDDATSDTARSTTGSQQHYRNRNNDNSNMPKTAPPAYQKRSSITMKEEKDADAEQDVNNDDHNTEEKHNETLYEVKNPSMMI